MATHSSVLAWRIPRTGEPGGLPSVGSHRVGHDWSDLAAAAAGQWLCVYRKSNYNLHVCAQSCPTLCNPVDYRPPGSSVHGISQVRILDQFAISYSRGSSRPRDGTRISWVSCVPRWLLHHCATWEAPCFTLIGIKWHRGFPNRGSIGIKKTSEQCS